jgi:hypothetical protein
VAALDGMDSVDGVDAEDRLDSMDGVEAEDRADLVDRVAIPVRPTSNHRPLANRYSLLATR